MDVGDGMREGRPGGCRFILCFIPGSTYPEQINLILQRLKRVAVQFSLNTPHIVNA
jgi:hypothetical protein